VEILLTLPNEITLAGPVRVRCLGRVQRTEARDEGSVGVVAAIERYEFLRNHEDNYTARADNLSFCTSSWLAHCGGGRE
jgi:hypothetical protein